MMRIKLWGTRGSLPSPLTPMELDERMAQLITSYDSRGKSQSPQDFIKSLPYYLRGGWGGNTSCTQVISGDTQIIIDAGTGIRSLAQELMKGPCGKGKGEVHLVFSHFHWDHLVGLPFFLPLYTAGNKIHVYAVQKEIKQVFQVLFKKPYFPVPLADLSAKIIFHALKPRRENIIGSLSIAPYKLDHPDPCWGFRIVGDGRVYGHCVDTECSRASRKKLGPDLPLYQGIDLMLFDAQYTLSEAVERLYWGHSAATFGLDIAMREGIGRMLFTHPDPSASDKHIAEAAKQTQEYYKKALQGAAKSDGTLHEVKFEFVREGSEYEV